MKVSTRNGLIAALCATFAWSAGAHAQPAWATTIQSEPSQEAEQSLPSLLRETRENPSADAWINLGQAYLDEGALAKAQESFLEALSLDYLSAEAHFGLGLTEYARGDFATALFEFSEVTRLFPTRFDGHYNRAVTLVKLRRTEEAVAAFQEAIAQAEPEANTEARVDAYMGLAEQLKALERFEEAAEAYAAASALSGSDELTFLRADALYQAGRGLEALPDLTPLQGDVRVDALIADIYAQAGQNDYALRTLTRAVRRAADAGDTAAQARLLLQLGLLQRDLGRDADAITSFERAAEVDGGSSRALYNLGLSYLEEGQPQAALAPLQRAVHLCREGEEGGATYLALASAFDQLGQPDEARRNAEAAVQRLSDDTLLSDATFITGRALYRLGNYRGALVALEQVVAEQPENADAQLWAGLAHYQLEQYRRAAQFYERAVQLSPESVDARLNLGAAYLASERYEDAELVYELLIQQTGGDADTFYNLGWSLLSQGRGSEARTAWQRASDLGYGPARTALQQYF